MRQVRDRRDRVLVVDDDVDTIELVVRALRRLGFEAQAAARPDEALALADRLDPHVIFLDLHMPGEHGHALGARLRRRSARDVQLVAVTGDDRTRTQERSERAGFAAHLVKPVRLDDLQRVARILARRATLRGG